MQNKSINFYNYPSCVEKCKSDCAPVDKWREFDINLNQIAKLFIPTVGEVPKR